MASVWRAAGGRATVNSVPRLLFLVARRGRERRSPGMAHGFCQEQEALSLTNSSPSSSALSAYLSPSIDTPSPSNHTPSSSNHDPSKGRKLFPIFYEQKYTSSTSTSQDCGEDVLHPNPVSSPRAGKRRRSSSWDKSYWVWDGVVWWGQVINQSLCRNAHACVLL